MLLQGNTLAYLFLQGAALRTSINPNPFFIRRGFRPLPKPLANLWQGA